MEKIRKSKNNTCRTEQENILKKLDVILRLEETDNLFFKHELTEEKEKEIKDLIPEIKANFVYGRWNYFRRGNMNDIFTLVKAIYKTMGYEIIATQKKALIDGKKYTKYAYKFIKKDAFV